MGVAGETFVPHDRGLVGGVLGAGQSERSKIGINLGVSGFSRNL